VNHSFKAAEFGSISEDNGTKSSAVNGAIWVENGMSEHVYDLSPGRFAWFDHLPRKFIGINDDGAALFEHLGDGTFARGDTACEADYDHGRGA
jgi:hypothetical protein